MNIKIQPTTTSEWYALIKETQQRAGYNFNDYVQNYLIMTLDAFTKNHPVSEVPLAIEFFQALSVVDEKSNHSLRTIGDQCLILSGLFPEHAEKRNLTNRYFVEIGQQAYLTLADRPNRKLNPTLFYQLGLSFLDIKAVLNAIRR